MHQRFLKLIEKSIKDHWNQSALTDYDGDTFCYKDFALEITKLHIIFEQAGINKGDKIALIGRNSSHWAISFFAILSYGAVAVPILHDFNAENVHHIINHSEAKGVLAANHNWQLLSQDQMPNLIIALSLEDLLPVEINKMGAPKSTADLERHLAERYPNKFGKEDVQYHVEEPDELAIINYTSGTTGFSKGVMIPYRSLWSNTLYAAEHLPFIHSGDHFVSMLPMAHMYGLAFEVLNGINKGCHIHFLPRIPTPKIIMESFANIKPKLIITVPLVIEKIYKNKVLPILEEPKIKFLYKLPIFKQLINKKIAKSLNNAFGDVFEELVIGGAAINKEVESFLKKIGFRYTVGYGMTECGPLITYEQWDTFKQSSVGQIVDRMEMKIDSPNPQKIAGEILVRGTNNMLGYYKNSKATEEVMLPDGWMRTGDLGTIDKDGFLFIRGRSKAMILSSNGQNIYPEEIEGVLNNLPYVSESLIVTKGEQLTALILPEWEKIKEEGLTKEEIDEIMESNLKTLNYQIPRYCKIANIELREELFEKTPKQSIKRFLYTENTNEK